MSDTPPPAEGWRQGPDGKWYGPGQTPPAPEAPASPGHPEVPPVTGTGPGRQWAMILLVALVLGAVLLWADLQQDDDDEPAQARTAQILEAVEDEGPPCCEITYEVTGTAGSASITMETPTGTSQQDVDVPLRTKSGGKMTLQFRPGEFVYLSAQNLDDSGTIKCTIRGHDGQVISTSQSSGAYVIAGCDGEAG